MVALHDAPRGVPVGDQMKPNDETTFPKWRLWLMPGPAKALADGLADVIRGGDEVGGHDHWFAALDRARIDSNDVKVFSHGANVLTLVVDAWLIEPAGGAWLAGRWRGSDEPASLLISAGLDEAPNSRLTAYIARLYIVDGRTNLLKAKAIVAAKRRGAKLVGRDIYGAAEDIFKGR